MNPEFGIGIMNLFFMTVRNESVLLKISLASIIYAAKYVFEKILYLMVLDIIIT